jgi:hypothetical protein
MNAHIKSYIPIESLILNHINDWPLTWIIFSGHARNATADLNRILEHKFNMLGDIALEKSSLNKFLARLNDIEVRRSTHRCIH